MLAARIRQTPTGWIAAAAVVIWLVSGAYMFHFGVRWHLDLRVYREAGSALYDGGSPFTAFYTASHLPFTYTPFALLALSPLAFGPLGLVETGWWLVSAACLVVTLYLMLTTATDVVGGRAWAVSGLLGAAASLALEPVRSNFDYGQINLILMVLVVADLTRVPARWRGVLIGLAAAIKLTPLIYLLYFAVAREWRSLLRGVATVVVVTAAAWAVLPHDSALYWFHEATDAARTGPLGIVSNQSWNGVVHRAPFHGGHLGTAVWLLLSAATLACGVLLTKWLVEASRTAEAIVVLALTELLVSPVSWSHHWSWLAVVPIVAVSLWSVHRSVAIALVVLVGLAVAAPYLWLRHAPVSYVAGNALVLGAVVALVLWTGAEARRRRLLATRDQSEDPSGATPIAPIAGLG
jgi:alpha-1,2-mannosyltransferase